ncbi:MAG TPA: TonB family protein [Rhizomicrobium sp.]
MKFGSVAALLAVSVSLSGCASVIKGSSQTIAIATPPTSGANCLLTSKEGNWPVVTPGVVKVERSKEDIVIRCTKPGWQDATQTIPSNFEGWTVGNLLIGGIIGIGIDAATGAINEYPHTYNVAMIPAAGNAPAAEAATAENSPATMAAENTTAPRPVQTGAAKSDVPTGASNAPAPKAAPKNKWPYQVADNEPAPRETPKEDRPAPSAPPPMVFKPQPTQLASNGPPHIDTTGINRQPNYPATAVPSRESGSVLVDVWVTDDGTAKKVGIHKTSGYPDLDDAAINAVRSWKFLPAMQDGSPTSGLTVVQIYFQPPD